MSKRRPTSSKIRMESSGDKQATAAEEDESDEYFVSVDPDSPVVIDSFDSADESPHHASSPCHDSGTDGRLKQTVDSSKSSHCASADATTKQLIETVNAVECDAEIMNAVECNAETVNAVECDAETMNAVECNTDTVNAVECDEATLNAVESNAKTVNAVECDDVEIVSVDNENCDCLERTDELNQDCKCVNTGNVSCTSSDVTMITDDNHSVNCGLSNDSSVVMSHNSSGVDCVDDCVKDSASCTDCVEPRPCVASETAAMNKPQLELQSTTSSDVPTDVSEPATCSPSKVEHVEKMESSSTVDVGVKKTAKKTLNQLHEQLLRKAAGVRVTSNTESMLHSAENGVESASNGSVAVESAESVSDKSAEIHLSVDSNSMDSGVNTEKDRSVVIEQCSSTVEQLTETEKLECDVAESEKSRCELAEMENSRSERTKSRKAAKPVKRGQDTMLEVEEELVAINTTPRRPVVKCRLCTYTCCSNKQLETHLTESHQPNIHPTTRTFVCRLCKYACGKKEVFERHMAHHTGQHTVRYYTCFHCQLTATDMSVIEEHLSSCHTDQSFRFEVLQETIAFVQQLIECLVCRQLYRWRTDFTEHCRQSHGLQSLADYLELNYAALSLPGSINGPRNLFQNLIPDDLLSVDANSAGIVDIVDDEDGCNDVEAWHCGSSSNNNIMGGTATTLVTRQEKHVVGTTLRFYCGSCNYSSENMDLFQSHSRTHTANSAVSSGGTPANAEKSFSALPIVITSEVSPAPSLNALASRSGSRNILRCHLCPFECSKMVHFRRHCEIHERGETLKEGFRCGYCHFAHNRLNCVKFHLGKYHGDQPIKMSRITEGVEMELSESDLYALRSRRGVSDSASRSSASLVAPSVVVVQSESDKYPALTRYESVLSSDRNVPTVVLDRPPSVARSIISVEGDKSRCEDDDGESLDSFENQLPASMIYQDPMKCPKCDFTNRVHINLVRHLKLHRDEPNDSGTELITEDGEQFDVRLLKDLETIDTEANNSRSDDQPLLRRMLTESAQGRMKGNEAISDEPVSTPIDDEILKAIQSTPQDYREFCTKLPHEDLFQCHYCNFTNRFPSKVKRHFHYRHAQRPPYRCGHCTFEAVERGKVAKHCNAVHRSLPLLVLEQENLAEGLKPTAAAAAVCKNSSNNGSVLAELLTADNRCKTPSNTSLKIETLDIDLDAPSLDYYPKSENNVSAADDSELETSVLTGNDKSRLSTSLTSVHSDRSGVSTRSQLSLLTVKTEEPEETLTDTSCRSSGGSRMCRRQFRCGYCGVVSKWNRRDICLHVMHVHIQRRVFTCRHCNFGNSKNKSIVRAHCAKFHPQRVVSVRDDSALLNAVMQVEDKDGIVTVAFVPNGKPILDVDELKEYLSKYKFPGAAGPTDTTNSAAAATASKTMPTLSKCASDKNGSNSLRSTATLHSGTNKSELVNKSASLLVGRNHWKCRQCSYVHERVGRVRYHVICQHLKLKPFSCPHCHLYLWKPQAVISHIDKCHSGGSRSAMSTVDEKSAYLRRNVVHVAPVATPVKSVQSHEDEQSSDGVTAHNESQSKGVESDESTTDVEQDAAGNYNATNQTTTTNQSSVTNRPSIFRCNLCGFQDARNDKTKYHVVKQHLKLRQFSCPYCHVYLWGRQQVAKHVVETHPDLEVRVQRTFQEYEHFLRSNISKIEKTSDAAKSTPIGPLSPCGSVSGDQLNGYHRSTTLVARLPCDLCTFVTDSELSLSAHRRSHRLYQCSHCDYRHNLVAKVQSHCLSSHPTLPMEYKQWTPSPSTPATTTRKSLSDSDITERLSVDFVKFYPCDWCPAHFSTQAGLDVHVIGTHDGAYSCRHCNLVVSNKDDLDTHVYDEHPGLAVDYDIVPQLESSVVHTSGLRLGKRPSESADEDEAGGKIARPTLSVYNSEGTVLTYKCQLCPYECHKLTVMRHHVMSHLHYHPYTCPYCTLIRSVKSFPIKKHIRLKHPDREENFIYIQNDALEKKVQNSFCRVPPVTTGRQGTPLGSQDEAECEEEEDVEVIDEDSLERSPPSLSCEVEQPVNIASLNVNMSTSLDEFGQHKVLYRCNLCGLKTHIRMDMRHHIMREIQYKPFKCMYCTYIEPCRWSMRKHFRTKHAGLEVAVIDNRDPAQDDHVERLLEQCSIPLKEVREHEMLTLKVAQTKSPSKLRSQVDRPDSSIRYSPASSSLSVLSPRAGNIKLSPLSPLSSVALRLHRCPHCSYSNSNLKLLRGHLVKHGPCRLQCAYCDHRGHYPSRVHKHIRRHHKGQPFKIIKINADELPPALIAEDDSSFQTNKQIKSSAQNVVLLDGVALDIPVEPDDDGAFRCQECGYQSTNREHFKMHVVIHRPPKWQCYYCDQKYPLIFRLRRHSNAKHGNLPIKWIDLTTGQICSDQQKHSPSAAGVTDSALPAVLLPSFSSPPEQQQQLPGSLAVKPRATARKSTTGRNMMQVALFRSRMFGNSKRTNDSVSAPTTTTTTTTTTTDNDRDDDDSDVLLSSDDGASDCDDEYIDVNTDDDVTSLQTNILKFCCHVCTFSVDALSPSALTEHLQSDHSELSNVPPVEVLECDAGDVDVTALRRCGFCSYESYVGRDFEEHVMSAHGLSRPLTCGLGCMFASFSRSAVREHFVAVHPDQLFSACQLDKPYTMLPSDEFNSVDNDRDGSYFNFNARVQVENIFEMSDDRFDALLARHKVSFEQTSLQLM